MQHQVTTSMLADEMQSNTTVTVNGTTYWTATDISNQLRIARQTLWRWRRDEKVPKGRLYRGKLVVFSKEEVGLIHQFANRLSPLDK